MRNVKDYGKNQGVYQTRQRPGGNMEPGNRFVANYKPSSGRPFVAPRSVVVGLILVVALLAFEIFNFDTTRYALTNLFGDVQFVGIGWATILALAFCSIDFAGLAYMMAPERSQSQSKEVWYLMGAWLLGATMNAMMTWWAISLALLEHNLGNEVLSREQLLTAVPIFVAVLVWLTRILFIGAFSVAGANLFRPDTAPATAVTMNKVPANRQPATTAIRPLRATVPHLTDDLPGFLRAFGRNAAGAETPRPEENRPLIESGESAVDPLAPLRAGLRRVQNEEVVRATPPVSTPAAMPMRGRR